MRYVLIPLLLMSAALQGTDPTWDTSVDLDLGPGLSLMVNTGPTRSDLVPIRSQIRGKALTVDPITFLSLLDLDEDGVLEVLTEETIGRGTGFLERAFRLYRVSAKGVTRLLDEQSFLSSVPLPAGPQEQIRVYIRHHPSGSAVPYGRLALHRDALAGAKHEWSCKAFRLEHGRVSTTPCP